MSVPCVSAEFNDNSVRLTLFDHRGEAADAVDIAGGENTGEMLAAHVQHWAVTGASAYALFANARITGHFLIETPPLTPKEQELVCRRELKGAGAAAGVELRGATLFLPRHDGGNVLLGAGLPATDVTSSLRLLEAAGLRPRVAFTVPMLLGYYVNQVAKDIEQLAIAHIGHSQLTIVAATRGAPRFLREVVLDAIKGEQQTVAMARELERSIGYVAQRYRLPISKLLLVGDDDDKATELAQMLRKTGVSTSVGALDDPSSAQAAPSPRARSESSRAARTVTPWESEPNPLPTSRGDATATHLGRAAYLSNEDTESDDPPELDEGHSDADKTVVVSLSELGAPGASVPLAPRTQSPPGKKRRRTSKIGDVLQSTTDLFFLPTVSVRAEVMDNLRQASAMPVSRAAVPMLACLTRQTVGASGNLAPHAIAQARERRILAWTTVALLVIVVGVVTSLRVVGTRASDALLIALEGARERAELASAIDARAQALAQRGERVRYWTGEVKRSGPFRHELPKLLVTLATAAPTQMQLEHLVYQFDEHGRPSIQAGGVIGGPSLRELRDGLLGFEKVLRDVPYVTDVRTTSQDEPARDAEGYRIRFSVSLTLKDTRPLR